MKNINHLFIAQKFVFAFLILSIICGCSDNEINLSQIKNNSNKECIKYFTQVGFDKEGILRKWKTEMMVSVTGTYDRDDVKSIDEFVKVFNELSNDVKMKRIENGGNIIINFGEDSRFNPKGYLGLCSTRWSFFSNEITSAKILIAPTLSIVDKRKTIHHELLHAIGLKHAIGQNHIKTEYKTYNMMGVFAYKSIDDYEKSTHDIKSSELDKSSIGILYNNSIATGLKKDDFIKNIKN